LISIVTDNVNGANLYKVYFRCYTMLDHMYISASKSNNKCILSVIKKIVTSLELKLL